MNITETINELKHLYPTDSIQSKVDFAIKLSPEPINYMIPSIELGVAGLILSSLCLVTDNYLCDVRMAGGSFNEFDYVAKDTIFNYRFKTWVHEIKEEGISRATFELAEVKLVHGHGRLTTLFSFAGNLDDRDIWLTKIIEAIPVNVVLGYSCEN